MHAPRVALFVPSLVGGGAERMMVNLADGFAARGLNVDLVLVKATGPYLAEVPSTVRIVELGSSRVSTSLPALVRYLRRARPVALLSTLNHANVLAVVAGYVAGVKTRVVVRQANTLSQSAGAARKLVSRLMPMLVRRFYAWADEIVAVSDGVAEDLTRVASLPAERIRVIPNPVVMPSLTTLAREPVTHSWFSTGDAPVVLGVGRLTKQKDFGTLCRAMAMVRQRRPVRLVILGEGEDRPALERLVAELGIADSVALPGFVANPFAYMSKASLFVLSSAWEGLPGALIQAMACGTPVVATDCESGPREILQDGRFGRIVPVGDPRAMADAIDAALSEPSQAGNDAAWRPYTQVAAVDQYLRTLGVAS
ncbi:MAG TPA: glycosyltransferase [Gemmatimonadaceae bacterium]|nr:glycosyltransferase [Gemmatimonadaceae bacterium]